MVCIRVKAKEGTLKFLVEEDFGRSQMETENLNEKQ